MSWELVEERVRDAKAIAWDTCHKIYLLMDDKEVEIMRGYGYNPLITSEEANADQMLDTLEEWYGSSCGLRFIDAVSTADGFETLIGQMFKEEVTA